ncbi:Ras GTPase activating protein ira2 [Chytriomyces hyalinus]|nr:Ras GTPase activating protein ira2 [Chytriomyces hyalinus]
MLPTDIKVLRSIVESISQRLPCNSGATLGQLESDAFFAKNIRAIIELCPWRLWDVMGALTSVLKAVSVTADPYNSHSFSYARFEDNPDAFESLPGALHLHSQLFVLRLMACCLAYYWKLFRETRTSPDTPEPFGDDLDHPNSQHKSASSHSSSVLTDPPALDENLANFILNNVTPLFLTYGSEIAIDSITHSDFLRTLGFVDERETGPTSAKVGSFFTQAKSGHYMPSPAMFICPIGPEIYLELQKEAGKIIFYLSGSNWNLVMARMRQKLYVLTNAAQSEDASSSAVDLAELRFMEFLNINQMRLTPLITELNQCFRFLAKRVQYLTAICARKAFWNWVDTHPEEFIDLHSEQRRVEGSPDSFFLTLYSLCDTTSRRRILFWPTMTILLAMCPDLFYNVMVNVLGAPRQAAFPRQVNRVNPDLGKKSDVWFEGMRKNVRTKNAEVSVLCLIDVLRAASVLTKIGGPAGDYYRALVSPIDLELKDKLFSRLELRPAASQGTIQIAEGISLDYRVSTEALTAIMKLNPFQTLRPLISGLFSPSSPGAYRVILIRACYELVSEDDLYGVNASLASPLRALFMAQQSVLKNAQTALGVEAEIKVKKAGLFAGHNAKKEKAIKVQAINDLTTEHFDLIHGTLKVWAKSPILVVAKESNVLGLEDMCTILHAIVSYTEDEDPHIRSKAGETLRAVFATDFISVWDGSAPTWQAPTGSPTNESMAFFWSISSSLIGCLANQILSFRDETTKFDIITPEPILKEMLELLRDLLKVRTEFLKKHADTCSIACNSSERATATVQVEKCLLVLLCSPSNEIVSTSIACIGYLVEEMDVTTAHIKDAEAESGEDDPIYQGRRRGSHFHSEQALSVIQNIDMYRELGTLIGGVGLIASSRAMQRRVRSVLRKMDKPSMGSLGAWEEVFIRWKELFKPMLSATIVAGAGGSKGSPNVVDNAVLLAYTQDRGERQNYTGFLCAMGGVCYAASVEISRLNAQIDFMERIPIAADENVNVETSNKMGAETRTAFGLAKKNVGDFISDLQLLMVCENDVVREYVKNFLGTELNSGLFDILFSTCESNVTKFLGPDEINNHERNVFFVESFISVLKLILERSSDDYNSQFEFLALAGGVDFGSLVLSFVQYLNSFGMMRGQMQPTFLRIRTKVCQLVELVVNKKDVVALRQEIRFKNRMLDFILGWNAEISVHSTEETRSASNDEGNRGSDMKLTRDLDLASMRALVAVLDGLPIQLTTETMASLASTFKGDDADEVFESSNEYKGQLFHNYLSFFLKVLDKCRIMEALESKSLDANPSKAPGEYNEQLITAKETLAHIFPLKDLTIRALSNLLAANIDIGLKYSLSMGYHEDSKTRVSFMLVLTNLLETGGKQQFDGLGEEGVVTQKRYERLIEAVVSEDLQIALAMGGISDVEDVAGILTSIFESKGQTLRLLTKAIQFEVDRTDYGTNFFRQNSIATRLLTVYSKTYGKEYLVRALKPVLDQLLDSRSNLSFEIDPNRLVEGDNPANNKKNVMTLVNRILDNLLASADQFPPELRVVCSILSDRVGQKFPEHKGNAVGAFMFLRFIGPIIVAPWVLDIVAPIQDKKLLRGLVLATKVIQNLANNVLFGSKELFMFELNELLQENIGRVRSFLRNISEVDVATVKLVRAEMEARKTDSVSDYDLLRLHRVLTMNLDKVEISLTGNQHNFILTPREIANRKVKFTDLSILLTQLGPAPDTAKLRETLGARDLKTLRPASISQGTPKEYEEFLNRIRSRSGYEKAVELMRGRALFYESGVSKEGNRVLYFIARRVKQHVIDMDFLMYYVLSVLSDFMTSKYDLVMDVSQTTAENEYEVSWLRRFFGMMPAEIINNFGTLYIYRCHSAFARFVKGVHRAMDIPMNKRIFFVANERELAYFINLPEIKLPKSTINTERSVITQFDVNLVSGLRDMTPVVLKLAHECIYISYSRKQQLLGFDALLTDVIKFNEIQDVLTTDDINEFLIEYTVKVGGVYGTGSIGNTTLSTLRVSSPVGIQILQSLKQLRGAFKKNRRGNLMTDERTLRPEDVPGTLLNMAILNLGSRDPNLRVSSYNLLYALSTNFGFQIGNQLLSAKNMYIPSNDLQFIRVISQKLATSEKSLTLEFLIECVIGFNRSTMDQKILCLEYMSPWMRNLAMFARSDASIKTMSIPLKLKSLIRLLIELTVKETELYHLIQINLWAAVGTVKEIVPSLFYTFLQTAVDSGVGSVHAAIITNTLRSIASVNSELVTSRVISQLMELAGSDSIQVLMAKGTWAEVAVLIRFLLMLSFNDLLNVRKFAPELFHIVTLVIGHGQPLIRHSVHGMAVNIIHSLATIAKSSPGRNDGTVKALTEILTRFADPKFRASFGITASKDDADVFSSVKGDANVFFLDEVVSGDVSNGVSITDLKAVTSELVKVIETGCGNWELAQEWKERWLELVVKGTFNFSVVQSRTFITLGALSRTNGSVDLLFRSFSSLMGYLALYDESEVIGLNVSIITCITDIVNGLPTTPDILRLLKMLFWVAMGLIQISDPYIFAAGIVMLHDIIKILDAHGEFKALGFAETLKQARQVFLKLAMDIDDVTGIWFNVEFSFAFAANVIKGLKEEERTRRDTIALLRLALEVSGKNPPEDVPASGHEYIADHCAGYIIPLLPITPATELAGLFKMGGVDEDLLHFEWAQPKKKTGGVGDYVTFGGGLFETDENNKFRDILDRLTPLTDENRSILILTMMVGILEISELEAEAIFIYGFLAEATLQAPEIVFVLYESLLPRMNEIVTGPNSPNLIAAVHSIFQTMMACMPLSPPSAPQLVPQFQGPAADSAGISGILTNINNVMGGFNVMSPSTRKEVVQAAASAIINSNPGTSQPVVSNMSSSSSMNGDFEGEARASSSSSILEDTVLFQGTLPHPLHVNQQLLSYLQELGFGGVASANSFETISVVQQKQIAGLVVMLIRVVLVQLQNASVEDK